MSTEAKGMQDLPGVGPATIDKLQNAGFLDVLGIAVASPGQLTEAAGVTEAVGRKIIQAARDMLEMGFESGEELLAKRARVFKISTGCQAFDEMLGGGVESNAIVETFAQYGGGKTQLAHILAVQIQKEDPESVAVYIDTEGSFRPERIKQIAEAEGLDADEVLKNVKVARAYNSDHQMILAEKAEELITKQNLKVKLIVVDSLTSHFRAEFVGRGTLADRQQKINKHMHTLARIANKHNVAIFVTNQVMSKPDAFFGDPTEAIGGHIVGHNSTFRIYLRKGKKGTRVAKLVDSPNLPESECGFNVTEKGFEDL